MKEEIKFEDMKKLMIQSRAKKIEQYEQELRQFLEERNITLDAEIIISGANRIQKRIFVVLLDEN